MSQTGLALTFAGGGNRAFYQLGLLNRWGSWLLPRVECVAAVSAGACVAAFYLTGRQEEIGEFWEERRRHVQRNFDVANLARRKRMAPHGEIYRDTLLYAFSKGGLEKIRSQRFPVLVLTARFPRYLPGPLAVSAGIGAYQLEKRIRKRMIHPSFGRALGFRPHVVDARDCTSAEELADLVIASSATPPFTPVGRFRGEPLLDGGLVDNVPAFVVDFHSEAQRNVVLLTRPYPEGIGGLVGDRLYLAPSRPVPVGRWDYTRPDLVRETILLGESDADLYRPQLEEFLAYDRVG